MTVYGGMKVTYESKSRGSLRTSYNKATQLAELAVGGDFAGVMSLNASELSAFISECSRALGLMLEDPGSIGYDAVKVVTTRAIDRLEHLIPSTGIRPLGGAYE